VRLSFDPQEIPFVGICFNLNAWPFTGEKARWVAVEPSTGPTDKLDESDRMCEIRNFTPQRPVTFTFTLTLSSLL
jgi:hypothetical protein